jgi:hypothetical protein
MAAGWYYYAWYTMILPFSNISYDPNCPHPEKTWEFSKTKTWFYCPTGSTGTCLFKNGLVINITSCQDGHASTPTVPLPCQFHPSCVIAPWSWNMTFISNAGPGTINCTLTVITTCNLHHTVSKLVPCLEQRQLYQTLFLKYFTG